MAPRVVNAGRVAPDEIAFRLADVRRRIAAAASITGRSGDDVTLVAVSKAQSVESIAAAYAAGHRDFGENRTDELVDKANRLPEDIRWHFVGALQSRKAQQVRPLASLLHSLDRRSLIRRWAGPGSPPALVQVNIGAEPQKAGVMPDELPGLLDEVSRAGIDCRGLMIIPPRPVTSDNSRMWFRRLVELRDAQREVHRRLVELSMGMTEDFEVAIEEGSTMVRVGRAIFGARA